MAPRAQKAAGLASEGGWTISVPALAVSPDRQCPSAPTLCRCFGNPPGPSPPGAKIESKFHGRRSSKFLQSKFAAEIRRSL